MTYKFSKKSLDNLNGVHPDLRALAFRALELSPVDFMVIEGLRSKSRQRELVARGASKTMNSRHLTGHAIDIVPVVGGKVSWDWPHYYPLAEAVKKAAKELGIPIEWGGDWRSFKDGPHWQLPWKQYPKDQPFDTEVDSQPRITEKTETRVKSEAVTTAVGGGAAGTAVCAEPIVAVTEALTDQTDNVTSGDVVRIIIGVTIVGLAVFGAWRALR